MSLKTVLLAAMALTLGVGASVGAETKSKATTKPYTLATCIVSDEKLGDMGDPHVIQYKGREIKFCCDHCEKDFSKEPQKFLAKLEKSEKSPATKPSTQKSEAKQDGHDHHNHKH